jgi:hypothetical protein
MLAIALCLPVAFVRAEEGVTKTLDATTAVPYTTLDPSLRFSLSAVLLTFGIPELTTAPEFADRFGNHRMWVADASTLIPTSGLKETNAADEIILSMDANNMIVDTHLKAEREFADARQPREVSNIRWHSIADIALVMNNG